MKYKITATVLAIIIAFNFFSLDSNAYTKIMFSTSSEYYNADGYEEVATESLLHTHTHSKLCTTFLSGTISGPGVIIMDNDCRVSEIKVNHTLSCSNNTGTYFEYSCTACGYEYKGQTSPDAMFGSKYTYNKYGLSIEGYKCPNGCKDVYYVCKSSKNKEMSVVSLRKRKDESGYHLKICLDNIDATIVAARGGLSTYIPATMGINGGAPAHYETDYKDPDSYDKGIDIGKSKFYSGPVFDITKNGRYQYAVYIRDENGYGNPPINLVYEVTDFFSLSSVTPSTTEWTNEDITVTVNADGADGYSMDGENYQSENTFTVSENGTYTFYAKSGTATDSKSLTISNIDKTPPELTVEGGSENYQHEDVIMTASYSDNLSGVNDFGWYEEINGEWVLKGEEETFTATHTGNYKCCVYDAAGNGNVAGKHIYIDKSVPSLTLTATKSDGAYEAGTWAREDIDLSVTDNTSHESGYSVRWIRDGSDVDGELNKHLDCGGMYRCIVTTGAGLTSYVEICVRIDKVPPVINSISGTKSPSNNLHITINATDPE